MVLTIPGARSLEVQVTQRGNFRRRRSICSFPPLRLNFKRSEVRETVFAGQNRLKLVTHCRSPQRYQQNVFKEYLAYRIYNLLTDSSFKTRLAKVKYVDTSGRQNYTRYGFIIEDVGALAKRLHATHIEPGSIAYNRLDDRAATRVAVFEYLIGNLDFALTRPQAGDTCCHNIKLLQPSGKTRVVPIPYDFDLSGLVNASYAGPPAVLAKRYGLHRVTDRLYRGFCIGSAELDRTLQSFNDEHDPIYKLLATPGLLDKREQRMATRYFDSFYRDINDPTRVRQNLVSRMRGCR